MRFERVIVEFYYCPWSRFGQDLKWGSHSIQQKYKEHCKSTDSLGESFCSMKYGEGEFLEIVS